MPLNFAAIGRTLGPFEHAYDWKDVALYALALGAGADQLEYLLEPAPKVLPTWGVIPATEPVFAALEGAGGRLAGLLHSAQLTEQIRPFPPSGTVSTSSRVLGVWDMRVGTLMQIETRSSLRDELYARTVWSLLLGREADLPTERPPPLLRTKPPKDAAPSFSSGWTTQPAQALLYRLTGDLNPIHARPDAAQAAGLEQPILHGLCTYGFAARAALAALGGDDPRRFKSFEARFTKPVLPGQTLVADGYVLEPGKAAVTVRIAESDELAIAHGLFQYEV